MMDRSYNDTGEKLASIIQPTVTENLEQQRDVLLSRLQEIDAALDALKGNPEIERVINPVSKVQRIY